MTKTRFLALVTVISLIVMSIFTTLISYARRPSPVVVWMQTRFTIRDPILRVRQSYSLLEFRWVRVTMNTITVTIRSTALSLRWYKDRITRQLLNYSIRVVRNITTGLALWLATVQIPFPTLTSVRIDTDDDTNGTAARHDGMRRSPDSIMLSGTRPQLSLGNLIAAAA